MRLVDELQGFAQSRNSKAIYERTLGLVVERQEGNEMKGKVLLDILVDHADALNVSNDVELFDTNVWIADYLGDRTHLVSLLSLLQLAQSIKRVMLPTRPSSSFRQDLHWDLVQEVAGEDELTRPLNQAWWWGAAVGSVVSITGLLFLRRYRSLSSSQLSVVSNQ